MIEYAGPAAGGESDVVEPGDVAAVVHTQLDDVGVESGVGNVAFDVCQVMKQETYSQTQISFLRRGWSAGMSCGDTPVETSVISKVTGSRSKGVIIRYLLVGITVGQRQAGGMPVSGDH